MANLNYQLNPVRKVCVCVCVRGRGRGREGGRGIANVRYQINPVGEVCVGIWCAHLCILYALYGLFQMLHESYSCPYIMYMYIHVHIYIHTFMYIHICI